MHNDFLTSEDRLGRKKKSTKVAQALVDLILVLWIIFVILLAIDFLISK